ncbi:DUF58 domain-containing protein [Plantibacter flavus]|uniref:DUF58 domain-containing protein n=1 Tax=Plantibacter flavus TaxID=150123 RepID=UPI003F14C954
MSTPLLHRVKSKLFIHAHRRVRGMLDGEYRSVFQGRSLDFDDLREYAPGDEIKDIDWKATARHGSPLIKRYIANRKHQVLFAVDTGRDLAALAAGGTSKREVALLAVGVLGYLAIRHGDLVGLVAGDTASPELVRPAGTESALERLLQHIDRRVSLEAPQSDLDELLGFVARSVKQRCLLVIVSDDEEFTPQRLAILRRLHVQHEVLWISIGDADLMRAEYTDRSMFDVDGERSLPSFVRADDALRREFVASVADATARHLDQLEALGISGQRITGTEDVVPGLFHLLEAHQHARR